MKTYSQKPAEVTRTWHLIDAGGVTLGRLATLATRYLIGKHKPTVTPHTDGGDGIIIINAQAIKVTGNKATQKRYYRHSGYPGGLKSKTFEQLQEQDPARVIMLAVDGMLPRNKLKDQRLNRLKIYAGSEHPHAPQQPQELKV